jgi:hypothetical protein
MDQKVGPTCEIVFPIVLIDGRLFECYLDQESQVGLSEITSGILLWRNPMVRMPHTIIRILTVAGLADFVSDASDTAEFLLTSCDSELVEADGELNDAARAEGLTVEDPNNYP